MNQTLNTRKIIQIAVVIFLLIALPVALLLSRQRQEIRKKAAGNAYLALTNATPSVGSSVTATLGNIPAGTVFVYGKIILPSNVTAVGAPLKVNGSVVALDSIKVSGSTYELYGGAHSAGTSFSGNLFSVTFTVDAGAAGVKPVQYQLTTVNIDGGVTTNTGLLSDATFTVSSTEPTNSVSVGTVEPIMTGTTITGYKVRVTATGNPAPAKTFGGETAGCAVKILGALPSASEADIKATLASTLDACLDDGVTTYDLVFSSGACGQQRKIWATFHNDSVTTASNYWPNTAWSTLQSSAVINVPLLPTPTATPVVNLPSGDLWTLLLAGNTLPVEGSPASYALYDLWTVIPSNGVIDGYDYVKWLMSGGALQ